MRQPACHATASLVSVRIATWNVNSLKQRIPRLLPWLDERLPDASHWVHHDESERVTQLLIDFFAPARAASSTEAKARA